MRSLRYCSLPLSTAAIALSLACASSQKPEVSEPKEAQTAPKAKEVRDPRYLSLPTPGPAPDWAPPAANKITLENGLSVWQMNHGGTPLVSIHLVLPTGGALDPPNKAGLALLTADMLDEGAGKYSALELSERLGELATDYSSSAGVDYVLLSMEALSENLEESLELLGDIVMRPQLTKTEFERRKQHHLAEAVSNQDDPGEAQSKAMSRVLFGQDYAGLPPGGTEKTLREITWADVKKHARSLAVPDGAHLVIAGMTDETKTLEAVKKILGKWKGKRKVAEFTVAEPQKGGRAYLIDFPGAAQSSVAIATRAGSNTDPNYFAEEVMNQKFGESFTGRINMNLREDKGYTYGAFSRFRRYKEAGYYAVAANVKSETTGDSVREVFKEFKELCSSRPLSDEELSESVEGLLLGYPMTFDEVSSLGYRLVTLPVRGHPADYWTTWPTEIKKITTARANEAAAPYCDPASYSVIIAGDRQSVAPQLDQLGLPIEFLDRDGLAIEEEAAPKSTAAGKNK